MDSIVDRLKRIESTVNYIALLLDDSEAQASPELEMLVFRANTIVTNLQTTIDRLGELAQ